MLKKIWMGFQIVVFLAFAVSVVNVVLGMAFGWYTFEGTAAHVMIGLYASASLIYLSFAWIAYWGKKQAEKEVEFWRGISNVRERLLASALNQLEQRSN